jgi:hypothetical protein
MRTDTDNTWAWGRTAQAIAGYAPTDANNAQIWGLVPVAHGQLIRPSFRQWVGHPWEDRGMETPMDDRHPGARQTPPKMVQWLETA